MLAMLRCSLWKMFWVSRQGVGMGYVGCTNEKAHAMQVDRKCDMCAKGEILDACSAPLVPGV